MPVHNWKNVEDGIFHDFHCSWITTIKSALNQGLLPDSYYALCEQRSASIVPDVLALEIDSEDESETNGGTAVLAPPRTTLKKTFNVLAYVNRQNRVVIRHTSNKKIAAVFEIVSRGNKSGEENFEAFMSKARNCLNRRIHFTFVDVHTPGKLDPHGMHGAMCLQRGEEPPELPIGKVLAAAGYEASAIVNGYINPFGLGDAIPETPLFLRRDFYVMLPLEETYMKAFSSTPAILRKQIEANRA